MDIFSLFGKKAAAPAVLAFSAKLLKAVNPREGTEAGKCGTCCRRMRVWTLDSGWSLCALGSDS